MHFSRLMSESKTGLSRYDLGEEQVKQIKDLIARALAEDVGDGDITTLATVPKEKQGSAKFLAKDDGVVAGLGVVELVLSTVDPNLKVSWMVEDGARVNKGQVFGTVRGSMHSLLTAERLTLNLLQRMSGIATATRRMVDAVSGTKAKILDTRKTAPGMRALDKLAVKLGGGTNHRIGLFDMAMIKDNHIAAAGGIRKAVEQMHAYMARTGKRVEIEVETRTLDELKEVLSLLPELPVHRIMLDNMVRRNPDGSVDTSLLEQALKLIDGKIPVEASGNVSLETVGAIARTGVDFISTGGITHSVKALDISLKIQ